MGEEENFVSGAIFLAKLVAGIVGLFIIFIYWLITKGINKTN